MWSVNGRITWQMSPRSKLNVGVEVGKLCSCSLSLGSASGNPNISVFEATPRAVYENRPYTQITWSSPVTNRLLLDAGFQSAIGYQTVTPQAESVFPAAREQSTGISFRAQTNPLGGSDYVEQRGHHKFLRGSASYITGSHAFKVGGQYWPAQSNTAWNLGPEGNGNPPYWVTLLNGVPRQVTYRPNPLAIDHSSRITALFAQDQWTVNRFTVNAGVRFETQAGWFPSQTLAATPILPARSVQATDVLRWRDLLPRLGVAYDLFGNGRTALKFSANKYVTPQTPSGATRELLLAIASGVPLTRTWTDLNGDFIPQGDPLIAAAHAELGPSPIATWGQPRITTRFDPEWARGGWGKRLYQWEFNAIVQQQLVDAVSLNVGYFKRTFGNFDVIDNLLTSPSDFDPFCVTTPADARLPGGGNQQVCGLYNLNPAKVGQTDNFRTLAKHYGEQKEHYNGFDIGVNARPGGGVLLQGGMNTGRTMTDNCDVLAKLDNPSQVFCHQESGWVTQAKFMGSYRFPGAIDFAATYQNSTGGNLVTNLYGHQAITTFTNAQIAPSLGRNLSAGANSTITQNVVEPGSLYPDRTTSIDLRFSRAFRARGVSYRAMLDLYNATNAAIVTAFNNNYGPAWLNANQLTVGRFAKLGLQIDF